LGDARRNGKRRSIGRGADDLSPRRAARVRLKETGELRNAEIIIYLNRLGDLLWLFARWVEAKPDQAQK